MSEEAPRSGAAAVGRRGLIVGAAALGLGALAAVEAARARQANAPALTEEIKLRHLLRRAGFGASPAELAGYRALGLAGTIDRLVNYEQVDNRALDERLSRLGLNLHQRQDLQRWWILRMIYTARPLEEKMTLFWHGLLTSAISKVGRPEPMYVQNQFLRQNALGRFPDILKGISKDPAMMLWLDLGANRKGHPNENYARELMELFSLGIGHYTEQDVRESARAFTGWVVRRQRAGGGAVAFESVFNPRLHDDGEKTFLGQTGRFGGDDIIDIIVRQPASAQFIARKLFSFFAYPDPDDEVLAPLVAAYTASGYSIRALVRAILTSDAFYAPAAYRALIKSPAELVAGTARLLGIETDGRGLPAVLTRMGQELFNPPNVAGWPGGPSWLTSGTWLERLNFANRVVAALGPPGRGASPLHVPVPTAGIESPAEIVDHLADLLLDGQISPAQRQVLLDYASAASNLPGREWLAERHRGALYLALAMPEYHLA